MAASPATPRRVLVLTLAFGSGHAMAAQAVAAEIRRQAPGAEVVIADALERSRWLFRAVYVWPYWVMLRWAPRLWRRLFTARVRNLHRQTAPAWLFRIGCPAIYGRIAAFQPEVIVAAEVGACEISVDARRRALTAAPIVAVVTDHHAEPAWVHADVERYAVADAGVRDQLVRWGAAADRILVSGIPTASADSVETETGERGDSESARPLVLMMGGGMGPTRMDRVAAGLLASGRSMRIVAVAGHDRRARRRLAGLRPTDRTALTVCGWRDDIDELMRAASVVVTKPGGLTTAEASRHGLPAVLFDPIPGPEEHNAARLVAAGAALATRGAAETTAAVIQLLDDEPARTRMAERMRALAMPDAARIVAAAVLQAGRSPKASIVTDGAGHRRVGDAIGRVVSAPEPATRAVVVEVKNCISVAPRLTHVTTGSARLRQAEGRR